MGPLPHLHASIQATKIGKANFVSVGFANTWLASQVWQGAPLVRGLPRGQNRQSLFCPLVSGAPTTLVCQAHAKCMFPRGHRPLEGPLAPLEARGLLGTCTCMPNLACKCGRGRERAAPSYKWGRDPPCKRVLSSLCLGLLHRT